MDELTRALMAVVGDAGQVAQLYATLREFCHDIRNDLGLYRMQIYMARRNARGGAPPEGLEAIESRYRELERFVLDMQTICRPMEPMPLDVPLCRILEEHQASWTDRFARRGRQLSWSPPLDAGMARLDPTLFGDALDAFVVWRAEVGPDRTEAHVRWYCERGRVRLVWEEDRGGGQGAPEPRLPSLAPVLLARVVAAHGGSFVIDESRGFRLECLLPSESARPIGPRRTSSASGAEADGAATARTGGSRSRGDAALASTPWPIATRIAPGLL